MQNLQWNNSRYFFRNRYAVVRQIGHGGQGMVFQAINIEDNKKYAIKCQKQEDKKKTAIKQYLFLSKIRNPRILKVVECIQTFKNIFIVVQFANKIQIFSRNKKQIKLLFFRLLEALIFLQSNKISHLDLKFQNLVYIGNYNIKLIDFGISTTQEKFQYNLSNFKALPQQLQQKFLTQKVDVWQFGLMLYEALTKKNDELKLNLQYDQKNIPKLNFEGIQKQFEDVIIKCLNKKPRNRASFINIYNHQAFKNTQLYTKYQSYDQQLKKMIKNSLNEIQIHLQIVENQRCAVQLVLSWLKNKKDYPQVFNMLNTLTKERLKNINQILKIHQRDMGIFEDHKNVKEQPFYQQFHIKKQLILQQKKQLLVSQIYLPYQSQSLKPSLQKLKKQLQNIKLSQCNSLTQFYHLVMGLQMMWAEYKYIGDKELRYKYIQTFCSMMEEMLNQKRKFERRQESPSIFQQYLSKRLINLKNSIK